MSLSDLTQVLRHLTPVEDPNVLIGPGTSDDVGAYRVNDQTALVFTADFFAPVVDDPYWFGAIAASNALSDVYAKGVDPLIALNLVGFPSKKLPMDVLSEILRGGSEKAKEAGVAILGGHSVDDEEPKYGLAVVGITHPDRIIANSTARIGDVLILTKPLGIGIITTGIKRDLADEETIRKATRLMATLNRGASKAMTEVGVSAATDVTGYGLLGHLREMLLASGVSAQIDASAVPVMEEAWSLVAKNAVPGGSRNNLKFLSEHVVFPGNMPEANRLVLCDAQTSGGLLISVPRDKRDSLTAALQRNGTAVAAVIGEVTDGPAGRTIVRS